MPDKTTETASDTLSQEISLKSTQLIREIEEKKFKSLSMGEGEHKLLVLTTPIEVDLPLKMGSLGEGDSGDRVVRFNRFIVISPQFGIGSVDFTEKSRMPDADGTRPESWTEMRHDTEHSFLPLMEKGAKGEYGPGGTRVGAYKEVAGMLAVCGTDAYKINADVSAEDFRAACEANKTLEPEINPGEIELQRRLTTLTSASEFLNTL